MATKKTVFISFPVSILSSAYTKKAKGSLQPMLKMAYCCHIGLMANRIPDYMENFWEVTADYYDFNRGWVKERVEEYGSIENFICQCKAFYTRYSKHETMPYTVMTTKMFIDFYENDKEKTQFEKDVFVAYLALRSIIGNKKASFLSWNLLLSRMTGESKRRNIEELPEAITKYNTRKLRDKLRNGLIKKWKVQYYFKGRKAWYSLLKDKVFSLDKWVENRGTP